MPFRTAQRGPRAAVEPRSLTALGAACAFLLVATAAAAEDEFERAPIAYSATAPANAISRLQERIDSGEAQLAYDARFGYLPGVLSALRAPLSSQTLVFSKTSLQQHKISPSNPRALYFNDDAYVGFVPSGDVVEISVADPRLGTVFYTLDQRPEQHPVFVRQTDDCLICHGGSQTRGVPGHVVRSVYADRSGQPIFSAGSYRVDQTTPFRQRFGGWYATGTHGDEPHLGNVTFRERPTGDVPEDGRGLNLTELGNRFDAARYLTAHSDLVALMVLVHQTHAHNVITKAGFEGRTALHREATLNRELGEPVGHRWPSTDTVLDAAATALVECFLFCDEATLTGRIEGSTRFTAEFGVHGPRDASGRSLRDFDLERRLFRHPCSFLIYSDSFAALPDEVAARFWTKMDAALRPSDGAGRFAHLSAADRLAIRQILAATHPGAPAHWKDP